MILPSQQAPSWPSPARPTAATVPAVIAGTNGEDALQLTGYFVGLKPGSLVEYDAVGGAGGRGQDAGNGGPGGGAENCRAGIARGDGGGNGRIQLFLLLMTLLRARLPITFESSPSRSRRRRPRLRLRLRQWQRLPQH